MKGNLRLFVVLVVLAVSSVVMSAAVKLPSIFSDNMT